MDYYPEVLTRLQRLQRDEPRVAEDIRRWRANREKTLRYLAEVEKDLKTLCERCNFGREAGVAASISGLVTAAAGFFLRWKGFPEGDQLLGWSKYLGAGGAAAFTGATLVENIMSLKSTKKLKEVIEKDIELTRPLRRWVTFSHEVNVCFRDMINCDIASPGFLKTIKALRDCLQLLDAGRYEIVELIRDIQRCKVRGIANMTMDTAQKFAEFFGRVRKNPDIRGPVHELCNVVLETSTLISIVILGTKVYFHTIGLTSVLPFGGVKSLDVLLSALSLKEIKERQNNYFEKLNRVTYALESELNEIDEALNIPENSVGDNDFPELGDLRRILEDL